MNGILAALPPDQYHVGAFVASSFDIYRAVETAAATVPPWQYRYFARTDTRYDRPPPRPIQRGDRSLTERKLKRRLPIELGVRIAGFRTLRRREFITTREVTDFVHETDAGQNKRSNIPVRVQTILIGGPAILRSEELRRVLGVCESIIFRHLVPARHSRFGDIREVENVLVKCSKSLLTEIEISLCHFQFDDMRFLKDLLDDFKNVTRLTLKNIQSPRNGIVYLSGCIENMPKLEFLDISRNTMLRSGLSIILQNITHCTSLKTLVLDENGMSDTTHMQTILRTHRRLSTLSMREMGIGAVEAAMFETAVDPPPLREFNIGGNPMGAECGKAVEFIRRLENLEHLTMDRCGLRTPQVVLLGAALAPRRLTHLDLAFNEITPEAGRTLAAAIRCFAMPLRVINLSGNRMFSEGTLPILDALADTCKDLHELSLAQMGYDDDIAISLARTIHKNHAMTELDISFNYLTTPTILMLAPALSMTPAMQVLDFRGNDIDSGVFECLRNAAKSMPVLEYLYLDGNDISNAKLLELSGDINTPGKHVMGIGLHDFEDEEGQYRRTVANATRRPPPGAEDDVKRTTAKDL